MVSLIQGKIVVLWIFITLSFLLSACGENSDANKGAHGNAAKAVVEPKVSAVYSKSRLARNKLIKPSQIEIRQIPVSKLPKDEEYAASLGELVEAVATRDIYPGTLLIRSLWSYEKVKRLSQLVSPGKVALTIETNLASAMAFLAPNDIVDVIGSYKLFVPESSQTIVESRVLAVSCKVLAVHREFMVPQSQKKKKVKDSDSGRQKIKNPFKGRKKIRSVTIELDIFSAQKIALVSHGSKGGIIRLAAHSDSVGVDQVLGESVSSRSLSRMADQERDQLANRLKRVISNRVIKYTGTGRADLKIWSEVQLNAPYDEDGDAPLQQDQY